MGLELAIDVIQLILTIYFVVMISLLIPVILRTKTLLLELLQSIVGKVEDNEPFIHGLPPEVTAPESSFIAEAVASAEKEGLDNGTFRGSVPWEPPPDETKP